MKKQSRVSIERALARQSERPGIIDRLREHYAPRTIAHAPRDHWQHLPPLTA